MKEFIKPLFAIALSAICAFFALHILFGVSDVINPIFENGESRFSLLSPDLQPSSNQETPSLKYIGGSLTVGTPVNFPSLFQLTYPDGTVTSANDDAHTEFYLLDITNATGGSVITILNSSEEIDIEEISSAAVYNKQNAQLAFHNSGIYTACLRVYFENQPGVLYECSIPVEVN